MVASTESGDGLPAHHLDRDGADPTADAVGYRQHAVWLSPEERAGMIGDLRAAIAPRMAHEPAPGRARHLLSPILFPTGGEDR